MMRGKKAYPELYSADVDSPEFRVPHNNTIKRNTFIGGRGIFVERKELLDCNVFEDNIYIKSDGINKHRKKSWHIDMLDEKYYNI